MADIRAVPEDEKLIPLRLDALRVLNKRDGGVAAAARLLERWRDEMFQASSKLTTAALVLDKPGDEPLADALREAGCRAHRLYSVLDDVLKGRSP